MSRLSKMSIVSANVAHTETETETETEANTETEAKTKTEPLYRYIPF